MRVHPRRIPSGRMLGLKDAQKMEGNRKRMFQGKCFSSTFLRTSKSWNMDENRKTKRLTAGQGQLNTQNPILRFLQEMDHELLPF